MSLTPMSNYLFDINTQRDLLVEKLYKGTAISHSEYIAFQNREDGKVLPLSEYVNKVDDINKFIRATLNTLHIPQDIELIPENSYKDCLGLETIVLENTLKNIGANAFDNCPNIKDVWYNGSEDEKLNLNIHTSNTHLIDAKWHYGTITA